MPPSDPFASTLTQWIGRRAQRHGERVAITFLRDDGSEHSWTYAELWQRSCELAARLPKVEQANPRGLLLFPPGIEFLAGFLGCQIAGWIPVPTCYPKAGRELARLDSAARDCTPSALIGDRESIEGLVDDRMDDASRDIPRVITDVESDHPASDWIDPESLPSDLDGLALLQYTSGSTSEPKGVRVKHRNLMANLEAIRRGFHIDWQADDASDPDCGVFWLPFFHDMGLIGGILEPLYVGGRTVLISPRSFLQRPVRWLKGISDYRAVISGAPNFAFQLCVDRISPEQTDALDLSRWRIAFSGAEPVLPRTLGDFSNRFSSCGFSPAAFHPCYGLAEASLLGACGDGPQEPTVLHVERESLGAGEIRIATDTRGRGIQSIVSCGQVSFDNELLIVDPDTSTAVADDVVGEIWLRGSSISDGYWNRPEENQARFDAKLNGGSAGFCRTGDLGFLHEGHLYVTGRLKDVVIIGGRNLFPQDIETTVRDEIGSEAGQCVVFAVEGVRSEALAIVAELPRKFSEDAYADLVRSIRRIVIEEHEVDPRHILLVRQATIPLTSSGKVQRSKCRERFDADEIKVKHRYDRSSASTQTPIGIPRLPTAPATSDRPLMLTAIESWMADWLVARAGVTPSDVDYDKPFAEYGLDSMTAVEMSGEIEDWSGVGLTPIVAWNHPTVKRLSAFIVDELIGSSDETSTQPSSSETPDELQGLLAEIEQLSDDEINHALADKRRQ
ncbi:MAG: AMP-binding protein [Rubripirellula sp.]